MAERASADDRQLLRRFAENNSQEAFASLTARYLNLVYSVCRRELADDETAEDVTQAVFLILARKAPGLGRDVVLSGWLFQTARFAAKNARLQAQRRAAHEQKAAQAMGEQSQGREDAVWSEIEPLLNRSLVALRDGDRECVLLRFFQGLSFAEAGAALGLSEEAARKRVGRVLEKMRAFLGKEGVLIPSVALAGLLTAHAAKAVPITCQASIAHMTAGAVVGQVSLSLTGSHIYQLSEGTMKAMKIAQVKVAVGVTTGLALGLGVFAIAAVGPLSLRTTHPVLRMGAVAKPGHLLVQAPGKTLSAVQIAAHCRQAYAALTSYEVTSTATSQTKTSQTDSHEFRASAKILFARPGKIRDEGRDTGGLPFAYVSDGTVTADQMIGGGWKVVAKNSVSERILGGLGGITNGAATTVPTLLLGMYTGTPLTLGVTPDSEVREDEIDGHPCYVLTSRRASDTSTMVESLWIDEETFLMRRSISDSYNAAMSLTIGGTPHAFLAVKGHNDERFTGERLNGTIPDSTFTVPAAQ